MQIAARAAIAADIEGFLELRDCLLPVMSGRGSDGKIAQSLGPVRDLAIAL